MLIPIDECDQGYKYVAKFCSNHKIKKADEGSLSSYIMLTLETEKISYYSKMIIEQINQMFQVDELLNTLNVIFKENRKLHPVKKSD